MFGRSILVLVPHPDDEVLGAALAIRRALAHGSSVLALDLSHGCRPGSAAERIARRRAEADAAARLLGIARIPDDGLPARALCRALPAAYRRARAFVAAHAIDTLWVPAYEGGHADHDCANALAFALARERPELAVWEFAEYNRAGGRYRTNTFADAAPAATTITAAGADEARWKAELLALYRSEAFNLANLVGRRPPRESFRRLPRHDYARPPHAGRLFYERFHWVPLRVRQIDFTTGAEVSAAILAFLAEPAEGAAAVRAGQE